MSYLLPGCIETFTRFTKLTAVDTRAVVVVLSPVGFKLRVVLVDSGVMRSVVTVLLVSLVVAACGGGVDDASVVPTVEVDPPPSTSATTTAAPTLSSATTDSTSVQGGSPDVDPVPEYDVFLAAVAEVLVGTRFEDAPFEDPEIFAATGLLLCERMKAGAVGDEVVFDYLTELTGGDASSADDDQLILAGALMGAAKEALCPQIETK